MGVAYQNWLLCRFFPVLLSVALVASGIAFSVLGPVAGVKSGYVFIGLVLAYAMYKHTTYSERMSQFAEFPYFGEFVLIIAGISVAAVAGAGWFGVDPSAVRLQVLLIGLPLGYVLLAHQIHRGNSKRWLLVQIIALFAVDPVTKYLSTNFYFGRGDTPKHVYFTDLVVSSGSWQSIPETTLYSSFPGLQTLLASTSLLTGVSSYDSFVITGIATYLVVISLAYLLAELVFSDPLYPIYVALGVSLLGPIHRYAVYFYPQALAVPLGLMVVVAATRYNSVVSSRYLAHILLSAPVVVALWFTHHFTVVLFSPLIVALILGPYVVTHLFGFVDVPRPQTLPLVSWVAGSVIYWVVRDTFLPTLIGALSRVIGLAQLANDTSTGSAIFSLGATLPDPSIQAAFLSLFSVGGLYNIMLVCFFALGVAAIVHHVEQYRTAAVFVLIGIFGAALMIRLPLVIAGLSRMQLPLSVFVAFVIGGALYRLFPGPTSPLKKTLLNVFLVVLLATASAGVVADDQYALHSGPDLWESRTLPETQKEFSPAEMQSFHQSAEFSAQQDSSIGTDWHSALGLRRYGHDSDSFDVDDDRITTNRDMLLYRQRWPDHTIRLLPNRNVFNNLVMSEQWLNRLVANENKVHTTGETGLLVDNPNSEYLEAE